MKVKELIKRLQSLEQEFDVYIWNEKEHSLFSVEDVYETSDFGENEKGEIEWEDFVTIFPTNNPQPLFTLTAEEVEIIRKALTKAFWFEGIYIEEYEGGIGKEIIQQCRNNMNDYNKLLNRIKQYQDEHNFKRNF